MSIQSEINRILNFRNLSFQAVRDKGVTVPADAIIDDLPDYIAAITGGGSIIQDKDGYLVLSPNGDAPALISKSITANGTYDAKDDNADGYSSVSIDVSGEPPFVSGAITVVNNTASDLALQDLCDIFYARVYADYIHCFIQSGESGYEAISAPAHSSTVFYTVNVNAYQMHMEITKPHTYLFTGLTNMFIDDSEEWWTTIEQTDRSLSYAVTITIN